MLNRINSTGLIPPHSNAGRASRTGLIPPINAGDGKDRELTTAEEIRDQIDAPVRDARAGARKDAIEYTIHNKLCDAEDRINTKQALNLRWNLSWVECDRLIEEAGPLADAEIRRREAADAARQQKEIEYDNLVAPLKALGLKVFEIDGTYSVSGMSEEQLYFVADSLNGGGQ